MSQINYTKMSDKQLKEYFLEHRNDQNALQEYLARRQKKPVITTVNDSDFDIKIQESIRQQINQSLKS